VGSSFPFVPPYGAWNGISTGDAIKKVPAAGGTPITVVRGPLAVGSWFADDTIVFSGLTSGVRLNQVPAAGGDAKPITTLDAARGDLLHNSPGMLPRAGVVLYSVYSALTGGRVVVRALATGKDKEIAEGSAPQYVGTGHIVFLRGAALWAVPFDVDRLEATGPAVRLIEGVLSMPAIGRDGTLMYLSGVPPRMQLVWVDRRGSEEPVPIEPADFGDVVISPDGQRIAVSRGSYFLGGVDIWVGDVARQSMNRLTTDPGMSAFPLWGPDGRSLVYSSTRESQGGRDLFRRAADGTGPIERLTRTAYQQSPWGFSRDGKTVVLQQQRPGASFTISTVSTDGGDPSVLIQAPVTNAALSPDGRWIAYNSAGELWVRPFPNVDAARWQISTNGAGGSAKWAPNGRELFYRRGSAVMRVPIETEPAFRAGRPELLFDGNYEPSRGEKAWDVAPDGRFLVKKALRAEYTLNVVLHWDQELKRLVPAR
jgi:hypothetical protein